MEQDVTFHSTSPTLPGNDMDSLQAFAGAVHTDAKAREIQMANILRTLKQAPR